MDNVEMRIKKYRERPLDKIFNKQNLLNFISKEFSTNFILNNATLNQETNNFQLFNPFHFPLRLQTKGWVMSGYIQ